MAGAHDDGKERLVAVEENKMKDPETLDIMRELKGYVETLRSKMSDDEREAWDKMIKDDLDMMLYGDYKNETVH